MSIVYVYVGFETDHSRIEMQVDENQLVQVETNNFMLVVHLYLIPITGFSLNLASSHCVISLQDSTEHFLSAGTTRAIYTRTLCLYYYHTRFLCSISYTYNSLLSTFSSIFTYLALGFFPISHSHASEPPVGSGDIWNGLHHTTSVFVLRGSSLF